MSSGHRCDSGGDILFLCHRIPYPPNKGDKIRSYNLLRRLSACGRVHLGAFVDQEADWPGKVALSELCASVNLVRLRPKLATIRSARGLVTRQALSVPYYRDAAMQQWVNRTLQQHPISAVVVFSSPMAQYVPSNIRSRARYLIDFVDVDSDKWQQYAASKGSLATWVYRREAVLLRRFEVEQAGRADVSIFASDVDADLFRSYFDAAAPAVEAICNGVDTAYFDPARSYPSPYPAGRQIVVFTGAMDYWANADAVRWFAEGVLPVVRKEVPDLEFWIVGARPTDDVRRLHAPSDGIHVTGSVPDVRPYLAHARLAVAPMNIARGIQNKVLEAMSMGRPVVATSKALEGIAAMPGTHLYVADQCGEFAQAVRRALSCAGGMGDAARDLVCADYSWESRLSRFVELLEPTA